MFSVLSACGSPLHIGVAKRSVNDGRSKIQIHPIRNRRKSIASMSSPDTSTGKLCVIGAFGVAARFPLLSHKIFVQGQSGHRDPIRHSQPRGDPLVPTESRS
jgi:hypothetical protein